MSQRYTPYIIGLCVSTVLLSIVLCVAMKCSGEWSRKKDSPPVKQTFAPPQIPPVLASPEDRAAYLVGHYWEKFNFRDTTLIAMPEITEQAFAEFLAVLPQVPREKAVLAAVALMDSAAADASMFRHFMDLADKYLYEPNSPYRDEELYIPVLHKIIASPLLDELSKMRPQYQLEMALKNRPGDIAPDFTYTLSNGRNLRMHALKAEYTILFFNSPDCHDCQRVKEYMAASPVIVRQVKARDEFWAGLAILAVYPDGDIPLWKRTEYPRGIINSYDAGQVISEQRLYDLKAIPTLYLLDKDKRVILKDLPVEQIEMWLENTIDKIIT